MTANRPSPRRPLLAVLGLLAVLTAAGCDYNNPNDIIVVGNDIIVRTFTVDGNDFDVSADGRVGSYQRDVPALTSDVADSGAVLLYAGDEILFGTPQGTWTALPATLGYDEDDDGFVDITVAYTYSYDVQDLYIDVVASSPIEFQDTDFRLVLIPGELYVGNAQVDFSSYEAVRQAFALPE